MQPWLNIIHKKKKKIKKRPLPSNPTAQPHIRPPSSGYMRSRASRFYGTLHFTLRRSTLQLSAHLLLPYPPRTPFPMDRSLIPPTLPAIASPAWFRCLASPVTMRYELARSSQLELAAIFAELQVCTGRRGVEGCVGASSGPPLHGSMLFPNICYVRWGLPPLCQGLTALSCATLTEAQLTSLALSKAASSADSKARTGCAL